MSETIKVVCYKSKTLSNGEHPLMVCVCKGNKRKYKSLGISVKASHWDFQRNQPNSKCPERKRIIILINEKISELQKIAIDKTLSGNDYTASTLIKGDKRLSSCTVEVIYKRYIALLKTEGRFRYAGMYDVSYNSFIKFNKHLDIPFADIDVEWLKRYEFWMRGQKLSDSTISTRLRHLRTIFNYAISEKAVNPNCYPFSQYRIAKLNQSSPKRSLSKNEIKMIINYEGETPMEKLAIDIFSFSYYMGGINFIDIAKLRASNIVGERLIYKREKTKKIIIIPLQLPALQIIMRYMTEPGSFIFPILTSFHQTEVQIANRLHKVLAKVNRDLKEIGKRLKLSIPLTTYVARHSFATVLKKSGVSTSIISETLGHSSEKVTQIYLDSFDNEQINVAMKNLL